MGLSDDISVHSNGTSNSDSGRGSNDDNNELDNSTIRNINYG